jgi:D-alanine-D-alanine ligase
VKKLRVGVIYGGRSGEHEVSIASAAAIFKHLDRARYEAVPIRIEKDGRWVLADKVPLALSASEVIEQARSAPTRAGRAGRETLLVSHPSEDTLITIERRPATGAAEGEPDGAVVTGLGLDVVFPVLHGPYGEDGTVQGLLELAAVPYVGCGVLASAVGMDKAAMKAQFAAHGLPQPDYRAITHRQWTTAPAAETDRLLTLGLPLFVKPANLGSSVGISKVKTADALAGALETAFSFDRKAVVEAGVPAPREIECAVLGNDEPAMAIADWPTKRPRPPRCRARSSRRASSTTTRRNTSTADRRPSSPPTSMPPPWPACRNSPSRRSRPSTVPAWRASTSSCHARQARCC